MNSCDFCVASYNFADTDGDFELRHFDNDVQHDQDCGMIEMMVKADNISRTAWPSAVARSSAVSSGSLEKVRRAP